MEVSKAYKLLLSSSYDEFRKLHDFLEAMSEREGFSEAFLQELTFVVKEAFVNAVKHGNTGNEASVVGLGFESLRDGNTRTLLIEVADAGNGFAVHEIHDPTSPGLLMEPSGRGIFLMRAFAEIIGQEKFENGWKLHLRMRPY
ncbi:ATP-binding protein [Prosthecochloris sp.]|uniref:ATP-binding protein n=1 Tax=Prosthecochloris sp. TaxID=290513 RepID=UPI0025F96FC2|nr:ATP-binding protein [Prosthecochloris sp.]